jgi:hypothetical protein
MAGRAEVIPVVIMLTKHESEMLTWVGKQRFEAAERERRDAGLGASGTGEHGAKFHIRGCHAEFAASIYLNLYWRPTIGLIHEIDVGGLVEVRSVDSPRLSLIVRQAETDDLPYVLAYQRSHLEYHLIGWLMSSMVKRLWPLRTDCGDPMHLAPSDQLDDMEVLKLWVSSKRV